MSVAANSNVKAIRGGDRVTVRGARSEKPSARRAGVYLFALFLALYAVGSSGTFLGNADNVFMFGVTESIALSGNISVSSEAEALQPPIGAYEHLKGVDGRLYFPKGMSYSAILVPFYLLGHWLAGVDTDLAVPPWHGIVTMLTASLAGPLLGAIECLVIYRTVLALGFTLRVAVTTAVTAGAATILWPSSKSNFSEPLMGLAITCAYFSLISYSQTSAKRWAAFAGLSLFVLVLSQPAMLAFAVPVFTLYIATIAIRIHAVDIREGLSVAGIYLGPLVIGVLCLAALNVVRYGSPTSTGYQSLGAFVPVYVGAYGLLLSAGKSIFLYSPPLLLSAWAATMFVRRTGFLGTLPPMLLVVFLISYGSLSIWSGDGAWGPRYMIPLTGVLSVVMSAFFASQSKHLGARLGAWTALITGGVVQLVGVSTSTAAYLALLLSKGVIGGSVDSTGWSAVLFDPEFSPIVGRMYLLVSGLHRLAFGDSLTWMMRVPSGGQTPVQLAEFDVVAWWPFWLDSLGVFRSSRIALAVTVCAVILAILIIAYSVRKLHELTSARRA